MDGTKRMLLASFLAMEPPPIIVKLARDAGNGLISDDVQSFFYDYCINNTVVRRFPTSQRYLSSVLKQLILAAESEGQVVSGNLYEQHIALLNSSKEIVSFQEATERCYKSYLYSISDEAISNLASCIGNSHASKFRDLTITIRISLNMLEGGTGCYAWPAGLFLSEILLSYPTFFSGCCCLEIGAGAGVSSIILTLLNASKVIVTDGNLSTLTNLKHNLLINGVLVSGETQCCDGQHERKTLTSVECCELSWESAIENVIQDFGADVIIGADLIYDPTIIPHLVRILALFLSRNKGRKVRAGEKTSHNKKSVSADHMEKFENSIDDVRPVAFLATTIRNVDTLNKFISSALLSGLVVEDITHRMRPSICLPQVTSIDRSAICLHKLSKRCVQR